MAGSRTYLITGGILLVGGVAGLTYWYYVMERPPKSVISSAYVKRTDGGVYVTADVRNIGRTKGYFKIQALIVRTDCPFQGETGYPRRGGSNWNNILSWILQNPGAGAWLGYEPGQGWQEIPPGQTLNLRTPEVSLAKGTYNVYINAAVSKDATTQGRLFNREYYKWAPGQEI